MKIAIAGKGGSGKTTIAGTLARLLARTGRPVLAIDGDSNPNLALTLGIPAEKSSAITPVPRTVLTDVIDSDGKKVARLNQTPAEIMANFGVAAQDGVTLLLMARVDHAGAG